jgi:hypothetical protein
VAAENGIVGLEAGGAQPEVADPVHLGFVVAIGDDRPLLRHSIFFQRREGKLRGEAYIQTTVCQSSRVVFFLVSVLDATATRIDGARTVQA